MIIMIAVAKFCEVACCGLISGYILWLCGPVKMHAGEGREDWEECNKYKE